MKQVSVSARGRSPYESPPQHSGHGSLLLPKAKGMGEEPDPKRPQESILIY